MRRSWSNEGEKVGIDGCRSWYFFEKVQTPECNTLVASRAFIQSESLVRK